jgi:protein SCO1/2
MLTSEVSLMGLAARLRLATRETGSFALVAARRFIVDRRTLQAIVLLGTFACSRGSHFHGRGVVEDVQPETGQVVIAHEDIPGLMPAMTMNFDVADRKLLETLASGDAIDFEVEFTGKAYIVTAATVRAKNAPTSGGGQLGAVAPADDPAPPFRLTDQDGNPRALADWRGKAVLLDFIWTRCPGPCPILTGLHAKVEKSLSPELLEKTHFASISLDPTRDTPAVLREYGAKRGADFAHWSFLTGAPDEIDAVLKDYGVGSAKAADGQIEHVVVTFLIDGEGQIRKRYLGLDGHDPKELRRDLERIAAAR